MTTTEMRELDAWIAEHVMGFTEDEIAEHVWRTSSRGMIVNFNPHEDQHFALEVLKKCAERLSEHWSVCVEWQPIEEKWRVVQSDKYKGIEAEAKTIELAICLFAKQLFDDHDKKRKAA